MAGRLRAVVTAHDDQTRNQSVDAVVRGATLSTLLAECDDLEAFRRGCDNLYQRVRALFFLHALYRYHLPATGALATGGHVPFVGFERLLARRFDEAVRLFLHARDTEGPGEAIASALAEAYRALAFQTLADQVRRSVRSVRGNQWMFRLGHPADHPLRIRPELLPPAGRPPYPVLHESTPVRMDLSHSGWSDIFFLGMDFPEGARVLNVSVDLAVRGRDAAPRPPIEVFLRLIDEPVLRLTSVDLSATADLTALADVFDFARDYLGLLKAAVIAAGIVPSGLEGAGRGLDELLARVVGPGRGLEIVSRVNDIPQGVAAGGVDQPARRGNRSMHARDGSDPVAHRTSHGGRAASGGGARHPGRVAGRLRRRLAGQRRGVAGDQADRGSDRRGGRPGTRRQPRLSAAAAHAAR
ncbi:MAG: hypothetical protein U0736_02500 [Gemmataceae bacterium]